MFLSLRKGEDEYRRTMSNFKCLWIVSLSQRTDWSLNDTQALQALTVGTTLLKQKRSKRMSLWRDT